MNSFVTACVLPPSSFLEKKKDLLWSRSHCTQHPMDGAFWPACLEVLLSYTPMCFDSCFSSCPSIAADIPLACTSSRATQLRWLKYLHASQPMLSSRKGNIYSFIFSSARYFTHSRHENGSPFGDRKYQKSYLK
jgi:hypothetical protein